MTYAAVVSVSDTPQTRKITTWAQRAATKTANGDLTPPQSLELRRRDHRGGGELGQGLRAPGVFTVRVTVTDSAGNATTVQRTVDVLARRI